MPASHPSRRSVLLGGLASAAVLAVPACGSSSSTSDAAGGGGWSFTDDRGERVRRDGRPQRIVGLGDEVAALWDFGLAPVGTFGMIAAKDDRQFDGFDLDGVTDLGSTYGEIDVEKLASLRPDLVVTHVYPESRDGSVEGVLPYGFKDAQQVAQVEKIAPLLCIAMKGSADDVVARNAELATALGADLGSEANAAKQRDFERAAGTLREAAAGGRSVMAIAAYETDGVYVAQAPDDPALAYYTSLGVRYPDVDDADYYWDTLSWENAGTYRTDVVLYSLRAMDAKALAAKPTFAALPAARAGQVHPWKFEPMSWGKQAAWMTELAGHLTSARPVT